MAHSDSHITDLPYVRGWFKFHNQLFGLLLWFDGRWRGENVATSEVEAVISNVIGLKDAIVYGVEVCYVLCLVVLSL